MSEAPFEEVEETEDPTDTLGPAFQQVDKESQDNWNAEVVVPEVEEEDPA